MTSTSRECLLSDDSLISLSRVRFSSCRSPSITPSRHYVTVDNNASNNNNNRGRLVTTSTIESKVIDNDQKQQTPITNRQRHSGRVRPASWLRLALRLRGTRNAINTFAAVMCILPAVHIACTYVRRANQMFACRFYSMRV